MIICSFVIVLNSKKWDRTFIYINEKITIRRTKSWVRCTIFTNLIWLQEYRRIRYWEWWGKSYFRILTVKPIPSHWKNKPRVKAFTWSAYENKYLNPLWKESIMTSILLRHCLPSHRPNYLSIVDAFSTAAPLTLPGEGLGSQINLFNI